MRDHSSPSFGLFGDALVRSFYDARGRRVFKAFADIEQHFDPTEMILFGSQLGDSEHPLRETLFQRAPFWQKSEGGILWIDIAVS
jgi:hypothetical protein